MKITWDTKKYKLGELLPADYNPRQMSEKQNADLKASLDKFGLAEIPAINLDKTIIAGHQRIRILFDEYGADYEIPVRVPSRQLTKKEEKELNIRSNKNTGSWDWDTLGNNFEELDLTSWGFEDWEIGGTKMNIDDFLKEADKEQKEKGITGEAKKVTCPECNHEFEV